MMHFGSAERSQASRIARDESEFTNPTLPFTMSSTTGHHVATARIADFPVMVVRTSLQQL